MARDQFARRARTSTRTFALYGRDAKLWKGRKTALAEAVELTAATDQLMGACSSALARSPAEPALVVQYRAMRLAQSAGLFCSAEDAMRAVREHPHLSSAEIFALLESRDATRPRRPLARPADPREALRAAEHLAATGRSPDAAASERALAPLSAAELEREAPLMMPSRDLPESMLDDALECCAVCQSELCPPPPNVNPATDPADDDAAEAAIRQLPCSHAFHCACVDPWLTERESSCPLCRVPVCPERAEDAAKRRARRLYYERQAQLHAARERERESGEREVEMWGPAAPPTLRDARPYPWLFSAIPTDEAVAFCPSQVVLMT